MIDTGNSTVDSQLFLKREAINVSGLSYKPVIFSRNLTVILLCLEKSEYLAKIVISFLFFSLANFNISGHTSNNFFLNLLLSLTFSSIRVYWWRERSFRLSIRGKGFSILNEYLLSLIFM